MNLELEALRDKAKGACDKRCSDYDEDCQHVREPLSCWVGGYQFVLGEIVEMPVADGYCPLLRRTSTKAK
jgi:hypothetical protein